MEITVMIVLAALIGFAAGLFGFRVKSRYCRVHGVVKVCPNCVHQDVFTAIRRVG